MPLTLVGINFWSYKSQGWSEVYPLKAATYSDGAAALTALATDRNNMTPTSVTHLGGRVSDVTIQGDALLIPPIGFGGYTPGGTGNILPINAALQLRLTGGTLTTHSTRFLHGWWTQDIQNGFWNPTVGMTALINAYRTDLVTYTGILVRSARLAMGTPVPFVSPLGTEPVINDNIWTRKIGRPFGAHRGRRVTGRVG